MWMMMMMLIIRGTPLTTALSLHRNEETNVENAQIEWQEISNREKTRHALESETRRL